MDAVDTKYDILQKFDSVWFFSIIAKNIKKKIQIRNKKNRTIGGPNIRKFKKKKFMTQVTSVLIKRGKLPIFTHIYSYLASDK